MFQMLSSEELIDVIKVVVDEDVDINPQSSLIGDDSSWTEDDMLIFTVDLPQLFKDLFQ